MIAISSRLKKTAGLIGVSLFVAVTFAVPKASAYTTAEIQTRLPGGVGTAYIYDNGCRSYMRSRIGTTDTLRTVINNGASYISQSWLSAQGQPNTTSPTYVPYNATTVPLQVNAVTFLCGPMVVNDLYGASPSQGNGAVNTVYNDASRWVTPTNANDRPPNAVGNTNMQPARTNTRNLIDHFDVLSPTGAGYRVVGGSGAQITMPRNNGSRYWFSPEVRITYDNGAPIRNDINLQIRMWYRSIATYNNSTDNCENAPGSVIFGSPLQYSQCRLISSDLSVLIRPDRIPDYNLQPSVTPSSATAEPGQTVSFSYTVRNAGSTSSDPSAYKIKPITAQPTANTTGPQYTSAPYIDNASCATFTSPSPTLITCTGDGTTGFVRSASLPAIGAGVTSTLAPSESFVIPVGAAPGTKICRTLAIAQPTQNNPPVNRHSRAGCVVVGKSPYLSIKNGDAWSGGVFAATNAGSCSVGTNVGGFTGKFNNYGAEGSIGSFGEYGVTTLGAITNFGSGGTVVSPIADNLKFKRATGAFFTASAPLSSASNITQHCLSDAISYFPTSLRNPASGTFNLNGKNGQYNVATGGLVVDCGGDCTLGAGTHITVRVNNGDVALRSSIKFAPGPYTNLADIPSFTLIAPADVQVAPNVNQLDGYYQSYGDFYTCYDVPLTGSPDPSKCTNQLVINGAVTARKVIARRLFGNLPSARNAAELFRMRPDVFLSRYGQASSDTQLRAVSETELPPRY